MAALKALLVQFAALLCIFAAARTGLRLPTPLAWAALQGALAALLAAALRSDRWWLPLHLLFPLAVVAAMRLDVPAWIYLAVFTALALIYWTTFRTRVPLFLSNRTTVETLCGWLPPGKPLAVLDVGSGTGAFALRLARLRPDCRITGLELAPLPALLAHLGARGIANARLLRGDFWQHPLTGYDVVYAFLSPVPMAELWRKVCAEMPRGAWFVSNSFPVPDIVPQDVLTVADRRGTRLYCYRVGAPAAPPPKQASARS
jgi:hypothetical protein